jgi:hypothetical protein
LVVGRVAVGQMIGDTIEKAAARRRMWFAASVTD